jgi:hypothetical protein
MKPFRSLFVWAAVLVSGTCLLAGCGTKNYSSPPPATKYTIGGTVTGLSGSGLVLQDNGGDNLSVSANGAFTFGTAIATGSAYQVTVFSHPATQNCVVASGSGTVGSSNVTGVQVTCTTLTFTIGGTVSNLFGTSNSVVLQDNGGDNLTVSANGSFTFATPIVAGGSYNVTVKTQPSSPAQICGVTNGGGTANANVTSVAVNCAHGEWAWISGSNLPNQNGTYGTQGKADPTNAPGTRIFSPFTWTDKSGNLWLFGGFGLDSAGTNAASGGGDLNDLWKYNIASGQWTWVGGASTVTFSGSTQTGPVGAYGTKGMPAPGNVPGGRDSGVTWTDASGNFWLFGGEGLDSVGTFGLLNDLWKYDPTSGQWTFVGGSQAANPNGSYGTQGTAAPGNVPGGRALAVGWTDASGNLWLFGGNGLDMNGTNGGGELNDLWEYTPASGQWVWVGGSNTITVSGSTQTGPSGTYGTQNMPAPGNVPGARLGSIGWTDTSGNLWLFGGSGFDSSATNPVGFLNDLWKYNIVNNEWTWLGGSKLIGQAGTYGTQGTTDPKNIPGARVAAVAWTDTSGNFWLFGGFGLDSAGTGGGGDMNDLWKYNLATGQWTWMSGATTVTFSGSNQTGPVGVYGTKLTPAPLNVPGARDSSGAWIDASGNLWLFGGGGFSTENDLWMYLP